MEDLLAGLLLGHDMTVKGGWEEERIINKVALHTAKRSGLPQL